jgi:hypothetical protein
MPLGDGGAGRRAPPASASGASTVGAVTTPLMAGSGGWRSMSVSSYHTCPPP